MTHTVNSPPSQERSRLVDLDQDEILGPFNRHIEKVSFRSSYTNPSGRWRAVTFTEPIILPNGLQVKTAAGRLPFEVMAADDIRVWLSPDVYRDKPALKIRKARQIEATFQDPSETIFKRAGLKLDHLQTLRQHYGDNYPKRVLARSSTAFKLFPHIRHPGRDKLVAACQQVLRATGFERALLAAGASKKIIERARSFDHTKKSIYELCTEGLTFAKADAAARTPFMQQIVPFDPHNPDRIAIAARNLIKAECNMRGDGGRSLPLIQADLFREYSLEGGKVDRRSPGSATSAGWHCPRRAIVLFGSNRSSGRENDRGHRAEHQPLSPSFQRQRATMMPSSLPVWPARTAFRRLQVHPALARL